MLKGYSGVFPYSVQGASGADPGQLHGGTLSPARLQPRQSHRLPAVCLPTTLGHPGSGTTHLPPRQGGYEENSVNSAASSNKLA